MKKTVLLVLAIILSLAVSCSLFDSLFGTDDPDENQQGTGKYAAEFRGEWIRMDTGDRWYINGNSIKVNGEDSFLGVTLTKTSENVVLATGAQNAHYTLFAARIANASFNAQVVLLDDNAVRSVSGRASAGGGIRPPVKIVNPKQPDLPPLIVQPDVDTGEIVVPNQIPGDKLEIIPDSSEWGNIKVGITPGFGSDQNLGVIPLTKGDNFKVSLVGNYPVKDESTDNIYADDTTDDIYADGARREYVFELENIGKTNCGDGGWELSWDSNDFFGYTVKADFANIAPGGKQRLSLILRSNPIDTETKNKEIKISLWNYDTVSKKVRDWEDTVSVNFYSAPVPFRLRSEKQVQGIIKAKTGKSYYFKTERKGTTGDYTATVNVPWSKDEYTIAFLGATIESGSATKYSFAIDDQPPADWGSLRPVDFLRKYKPANEDEISAPVLDLTQGEKTFMGYLAGDSIDYYKVRLNSEMPESTKIIVLEDWAFTDQGVSVDGKANPGETLKFDFKFKNASLVQRGVYITSLTSAYSQEDFYGGGREIALPPGHYGTLGSTATSPVSSEVPLLSGNSGYRQIKLASDCPEGPLQLTLKFFSNDEQQFEKKFTIQVYLSENLPAPTNVKAEYPSEGTVRITWDKVTGAEGYHVYIDDVLLSELGANTTQYERSGLDPKTTYSFKVCAIKGGKEHGFSSLTIRAAGAVVVFNQRNEFLRDEFYNGNWDMMHAFFTQIYVEGGALYRVLAEGITIAIKYEDTPENYDPVFQSASSGYPNSHTWEPPRSGWARIKFFEIYTDVFAFSIMHPEQAVINFTINGISGASAIDESVKTITLNVPAGNLSNITPVVTPASGWICETSGAKDFNAPVEYIFSKENVKQAYTVSIIKGE